MCYSKALEFSEDDSCLLNRGIARVLLGETEKSLEDFNRSSKKQGTSALISLYPHLCAYFLVPTPLCLSPCTHTSVLISLYTYLCAYLLVPTPCAYLLVHIPLCLSPCTHTSMLVSCPTTVLTHTCVLISLYTYLCAYYLVPTPKCLSLCTHTSSNHS